MIGESMAHRFFLPPETWNPQAPALTGAEAHHASDVLRVREGEAVVVFDGRGNEQAVKVAAIGRDRIELSPGPVAKSQPLRCRISLAQAIPKGKNMDLIVQKATELGAAAIFPVLSERVIVRIEREEAESKREKWQRVAIEACKQSGQNFLPEVALPLTMETLLATRAASFDLVIIASLQPGSRHLKALLEEHLSLRGKTPSSVLMLIGPEGDFTPAEINRAIGAGAQPMTLGPIVLRSETAALYSLSVLAHELQG
jgi:16S rRNA (uracil1498-N3)-methyltransferase